MGRKLTHDRLTEVLSYSKRTGLFHWKVALSKRLRVGDVAGDSITGYVRIRIDGELWYGHRLAWFYVTGSPPAVTIDHRDNKNKTDNRWRNLRSATYSQNNANCGRRVRNKSGFKGVSYSPSNKGYVAYVGTTYLGTYQTPEEAHAVYVVESRARFGEFARAA